MIKRIIILLLVLSMLILTSCSLAEVIINMIDKNNDSDSNLVENSRTDMLNESGDGAKADALLEQIIEAINNKDKKLLESIFSEQALNEVENLDGDMDYLFDFVQGDIESWEKIVHGATYDSINNGNRLKTSMSWYYVYTDKQTCLLFFEEFIIDTEHAENVGVYMLQVIKAEDKDTQFDFGGDATRCAGIYKLEE